GGQACTVPGFGTQRRRPGDRSYRGAPPTPRPDDTRRALARIPPAPCTEIAPPSDPGVLDGEACTVRAWRFVKPQSLTSSTPARRVSTACATMRSMISAAEGLSVTRCTLLPAQ